MILRMRPTSIKTYDDAWTNQPLFLMLAGSPSDFARKDPSLETTLVIRQPITKIPFELATRRAQTTSTQELKLDSKYN